MRLSLTPATDMQSRIRTGLLSRGMAPHIADAFIMNFKDESGLNPGINEIAPTVPGSRGGFGLYQLTGPRRVAYEQFAKERGANPADVDAQLDFMMMELQGPESRAAKSIFAAPDTGSAAAAIVTNFLRPAEQHRNSRVAKYQGGGQQSQPQGLMETFSTRSSPQTEAPMQPEKATGLLGSLFPNMTADRQDRLAMGLSGLSMFPNQGVMQGAQQRMGERREDRKEAKGQASAQQQANRTLQWLQTQAQNNPNAAQALQMLSQGVIDAKGAVQMAMQQPEAPKPTDDMREYEFAKAQGFQGSLQDWILSQRSAGATNISNNVGTGESAFQKKTGELLATEAATVVDQGALAQRNLGQIERLGGLLESVPAGASGALTGVAANMGLKVTGASEVEAAQAIISQLVPQQRPPGSGVMSDADLELFKQSLPRLINTREGNRMIVDTMRSIAEYDVQRGQIARQLQIGQITPEQASQAYQQLGNPLAAFSSGGGQSSNAAPSGGTLPQVPNFSEMSDQELDAYIQKMGGQQ
jgi:hypothetical protein